MSILGGPGTPAIGKNPQSERTANFSLDQRSPKLPDEISDDYTDAGVVLVFSQARVRPVG